MPVFAKAEQRTFVIPYIVVGSLTVQSGVFIRGVVGPKTAIVEGA